MARNNELETKFETLKVQLMEKADDGVIKVVSNESESGAESLWIDSKGRWFSKFYLEGYKIEEASIDKIIIEYARILDWSYRLLEDEEGEAENELLNVISPGAIATIQKFKASTGHPKTREEIKGTSQLISDEDYLIKQNDAEVEHKEKTDRYIEKHRDRLLGGLIGLMEQLVVE